MIRRDYLQEIGLDPVEKTVPWPYALAILVILLAGVEWFAGWETKHTARHSPRWHSPRW
jgi:hypothetical protein